jgi:hypothetical protein
MCGEKANLSFFSPSSPYPFSLSISAGLVPRCFIALGFHDGDPKCIFGVPTGDSRFDVDTR